MLPSFDTAAVENRLLPIWTFNLPKSGKPDFAGRPPQEDLSYFFALTKEKKPRGAVPNLCY